MPYLFIIISVGTALRVRFASPTKIYYAKYDLQVKVCFPVCDLHFRQLVAWFLTGSDLCVGFGSLLRRLRKHHKGIRCAHEYRHRLRFALAVDSFCSVICASFLVVLFRAPLVAHFSGSLYPTLTQFEKPA